MTDPSPVWLTALRLGPGSQESPFVGQWAGPRGPAAPTQQACSGPGHLDPSGQAFLPLSLEQRCPECTWRLSPSRCLRKVCVLGSRRQSGSWGSSAAVWPGGLTLTCSLSPAAGTASVGTSSCLSLSQHPSPSSVFRHHYIPYFRGKVREAAGLPRATRSASCLAALCLLPHGHPKPLSHARAPRCVSCVSSSVGVSVFPGGSCLCQKSERQGGKRVLGPTQRPPWAGSKAFTSVTPCYLPLGSAGMGDCLPQSSGGARSFISWWPGTLRGCSSSQGSDLPVCPTHAQAHVCESVQQKGQFLGYGLHCALRFIC